MLYKLYRILCLGDRRYDVRDEVGPRKMKRGPRIRTFFNGAVFSYEQALGMHECMCHSQRRVWFSTRTGA